MSGYILLVLTLLFYISLVLYTVPTSNLYHPLIAFLVLAYYGIGFISSLLLTINVGRHGGFDWISDQSNIRHVVVGIGWMCMTMATLICLDIKEAAQPSELRAFFQWLGKSKSLIWLPQLMLVPYFFLLSTELRASVSPNVYKTPLMVGFAISAFMVLVLLFLGLKKKEIELADAKLSYEQAIAKIDVIGQSGYYWRFWDFTAPEMDERVRQYALKKIKEDKDWEMQMKGCLDDYSKFWGVYTYLDGNNLEHPEQFVEPIHKSISAFVYHISTTIQKPDNSSVIERDEEYFREFNIERLCRVLEKHFKDSSAVFRPNMLKLQQALETEPLDRFANTRNKYRLAVKNWLEKY
jgi:hypothetical protein